MAKLKFKSNGKWESIAAFQGEPGKDGAIQYTAGKGITIENDTISAEVDKQYVDEAISNSGSVSAGTYYLEVVDNDRNWNWSITSVDLNYSLPSTYLAQLSEICTKAYSDALQGLGVKLYIKQIARPGNTSFHSCNIVELALEGVNPDVKPTTFTFRGKGLRQDYPKYIMSKQLTVFGTWSDDIFTATGATYNVINLNYKAKPVYWDNTSMITPTGDYNPATKKYVDDAIAGIDIPESGGSTIDFGNTPVYLVSTKSGMNETSQHYILNDDNAPDYGASLRNAVSSGLKQFIISIFFTGHGMSMNLRYTIDDNGSILVTLMQQPIQVSSGNYIVGYSPVVENMVTNISSVETASMYLRVQYMNNPTLCPIEKNTATKSYVDNAITAAISTALEADY